MNGANAVKGRFLHVGCGLNRKEQTTPGFNRPEWEELRFDIDATVQPDIQGTMTDMSDVESDSMDALFSSHNVEHLYPHEVSPALAEFRRVLRPDGFVVITCPDLQSICALVAEDKLLEPAYVSPAGPISPIDMLYGFRVSMAQGNLYMAHRCGFTQRVLTANLSTAGFVSIASFRRPAPYFDLWVLASKARMEDQAIRELAAKHFPSA